MHTSWHDSTVSWKIENVPKKMGLKVMDLAKGIIGRLSTVTNGFFEL